MFSRQDLSIAVVNHFNWPAEHSSAFACDTALSVTLVTNAPWVRK